MSRDPRDAKGEETGERASRLKALLVGPPIDVRDSRTFEKIRLGALFAWVALGADGLSSSCYGPPESFLMLGRHTHLAALLALATVATVFVISLCYSSLVEQFPAGGGGYVVSSKLLGAHAGLVSGCALLVDYVLTITTSIAAAGDALFGLVDPSWSDFKLASELAAVAALIVINLRGVRESAALLLPIFVVFLAAHVVLLAGVFLWNAAMVEGTVAGVVEGLRADAADPSMGYWGLAALFFYAYTSGGGTYTGIEAVSNSMPILREPRVATARRTMLYMAVSLALLAGGLLVAYLLLGVRGEGRQTLNQELAERWIVELGLTDGWIGRGFIVVLLVSEGALLFTAAQTGFTDGPRVLANLAQDRWAPAVFSSLSERLTMHRGILLMGVASAAALVYTGGHVSTLVMMYAINVFITFSLSMLSMCRYWFGQRGRDPRWRGRLALFCVGAAMTLSILLVTIVDKFDRGGWLTLATTSAAVLACLWFRHDAERLMRRVRRLHSGPARLDPPRPPAAGEPDPAHPTAVIVLDPRTELAVETLAAVQRFAPNYFQGAVFLGVGLVDSGVFKGAGTVAALEEHTTKRMEGYAELARRLGFPASAYVTIGADPVVELERLARAVAEFFPKATFFVPSLVFFHQRMFDDLLHNRISGFLQRRLGQAMLPVVVVPISAQ